MDWGKAKNVIIAALLVTNLLLLFLNFSVISGNKRDLEEEGRQIAALLEKRGIGVSCEIPQGQEHRASLTVAFRHIEGEEGSFSGGTGDPKADTLAFCGELGISPEALQVESVETEGSRTLVTVTGLYEGTPIDGSSIRVAWEEGAIADAEYHWFDPVQESSRMELISGPDALLSFMSQRPEGAEITAMELVYWLDTSQVDAEALLSDTALPAWRICCADGAVVHIPAFSE